MKRVGIVGLGNMGRGMALTLERGGFRVMGADASAETRARLADEGIPTVARPAELCGQVELIILSLPNAEIVEAVITGPGGLLETARPGLIIVDTTTSYPEVTRRMAARLAERSVAMIDAPVSGGPRAAHAGTMTMVMGGEAAAIAQAEPVLTAMTGTRVHVGETGAGHVVKLINNLLCAAHLLTGAEAVRIAEAAGIDPARMLEGLNAGSGRSGVTQVNFPTWILNGAFNSGFTMQLMRKDVRLAAKLVEELGLDLPMAGETATRWADSATSIADGEDFNRIVELVLGPGTQGTT